MNIDEIEKRANAATAGPWRHEPHVEAIYDKMGNRLASFDDERMDLTDDDVSLICHAREDVPALIAECRRLQASLERVSRREAFLRKRTLACELSEYGCGDEEEMIAELDKSLDDLEAVDNVVQGPFTRDMLGRCVRRNPDVFVDAKAGELVERGEIIGVHAPNIVGVRWYTIPGPNETTYDICDPNGSDLIYDDTNTGVTDE